MSRKRTIIIAYIAAFAVGILIIALLQWKLDSDRRRIKLNRPFASLPSSTPLFSPQPISSLNKAQQPATASIGASVATDEISTPTPCAYPTPLHDGWNAAAFGGEWVGADCWTIPTGMQAIITAPTIRYPSPDHCKDDLPTFPRLPCQIIRDDRTVIFHHQCVKQVVDERIVSGVRLIPDTTCGWERERYQSQ